MKPVVVHLFATMILAILTFSPSAALARAVSFEDILKEPDNIKLNLQYARQEILEGRLQQAASALERLLLNRPNWDSVRLLYATVLYRMDDLVGAKRELLLLEGRQLSQKQEGDRVRFLKKIDQASSPFRIFGHVSLGGRIDSNPGLDPGNNQAVPAARRSNEEDVGLIANGRIRFEGDFSKLPGSYMFLQLDGNYVNFADIDRADRLVGTLKAGATFTHDRLELTPFFKATSTALQDTEFNRRWGAGLSVKYRVSPKLSLFATGEYLKEDFLTTPFITGNNLRDGVLWSGIAGFTYRLTEKQSFTVAGLAAEKESDLNQGFSYRRTGIFLNSLSLLGKGSYLSLTARFTETDYDQPDRIVTSPFRFITRKDERVFARAVYGVPLQTVSDTLFNGKKLPEFFNDVVMQVGISWTDLSSTSSAIEYENISGDVIFTKKFEF